MPNSLKCKIKHLCHNGTINERERDRLLKALEQEQKSEWEHDHEILKAYSNGANEVLDKIRAEIEQKIVKRHGLNHTRSERNRNDAFLEVLDIINKYIEENT